MTQKLNVIVIEDEKNICNFIQTTLENHDYKVTTAATGKEGLSCITSCYPDVVLLDLGLPDIDGLEVLRQVRDFSTVPVIVISARIQETEKVAALDAGADDYITKPFGTSELLARIRAMTRKRSRHTSSMLTVGDLTLDTGSHQVTRGGKPIDLSAREYTILEYMCMNPGIVLSREKIENHIWNYDYSGGSNVVDVYISYLRKKIDGGQGKKLIHTVWGSGWTIKEDT